MCVVPLWRGLQSFRTVMFDTPCELTCLLVAHFGYKCPVSIESERNFSPQPPPHLISFHTIIVLVYTRASHSRNFSYTYRVWSWLWRTPLQLFLPGLTCDLCFLLLIWVKSYPCPMSQWPLITLFHVVIQFDRETDPTNFRESDCLGHQTLYRAHEPNPTYSPSLEEKVRCSLAYD